MKSSRAMLVVEREAGASRAKVARAASPQRWTFARPGEDGFLEVTHQLLGDGMFSGETVRTHVRVGPGGRLVLRGIAATPLRAGPSTAGLRLRAASGSVAILVPGALVPHAASRHASSLVVEAGEGATVVAATVLAPGRAGMGEVAGFESLLLRTRSMVAGTLAYQEHADVTPSAVRGRFGMDQAGAFVSITALSPGVVGDPVWWTAMPGGDGTAVARLRAGGVAVRGSFATLGEAQAYLAAVELATRGISEHCGQPRRC